MYDRSVNHAGARPGPAQPRVACDADRFSVSEYRDKLYREIVRKKKDLRKTKKR